METQAQRSSIPRQIKIINIGLSGFARDLEGVGASVVHVDWSPPALSDPRLADALARLGG